MYQCAERPKFGGLALLAKIALANLGSIRIVLAEVSLN